MDERKNRQKVMQALERRHAERSDALLQDSAVQRFRFGRHHRVSGVKQKPGAGAVHRLVRYCEGHAGYVKSVQTIGERDSAGGPLRLPGAIEGKDVLLRVHPDVAKFLKSDQNKHLEELEEILRRPVLVKGGSVTASREVRPGLRRAADGFMSASYAHPEVLVETEWVSFSTLRMRTSV